MSSKKKPQDPFIVKLQKALDRQCTTLVYPKLRVLCAEEVGPETEARMYLLCNGHRRHYVPAIQYAIAHPDADDVVTAYVDETNAALNRVGAAGTADTLSTLRGMRFRTTVEGCTEGARRCPGCRTTDLLPYDRQTRRADELATTFFNCNTEKCPYHTRPFK